MNVSAHYGSSALVAKPAKLPIRDRRSAVACLTCRRRKIRCDVTVHGSPCTNCRLDNDRCVIASSKRSRKGKFTEGPHEPASSLAGRSKPPVISIIDYAAVLPRNSLAGPFYHAVISADTSWLYPDAAAYTPDQQALTLPKKAIIHTLLQYYFVRVYPLFPLIKETAFRESTEDGRSFSLLVLRAMLFTASCHIPIECARDAGYSSVWQLRSCLYRTVKNLYTLGIEKDPLHIAQATLLLAFHFQHSDPMGNTRWHAIAVENARLANALRSPGPFGPRTSANRLSELKRLWWCCILGDRLLAVGTRRPVLIPVEELQSIIPAYLTIDEVWDSSSEYYNETMRKVLFQVITGSCQIAVILTPAALSTDCSPHLIGSNVCIEKLRVLSQQALGQLAAWKLEYLPMLLDREANADLAVAVNLHLLYLLYTGARFALFNRHTKLLLSRCRCCVEANELRNLDFYLDGLLDLVSETNQHIRWFADNHPLYFVPTNLRCITTFQLALNFFWFLGEDLDQEITDPGHILNCYMDLDSDYGTPAYDASPDAVTKGSRSLLDSQGNLDIKALSFAEKVRLGRICHLLSVVLDSGFYTGDWQAITFDTVCQLLRRISKRPHVNDCSSSSAQSPSSSNLAESQYPSTVYGTGIGTPESTHSSADTPKSWDESQPSSHALSTQVALPLPVSPTSSGNVYWTKDASTTSTSLGRFDAATNSVSQQSMQDWAGDLEEFMGPLFGM